MPTTPPIELQDIHYRFSAESKNILQGIDFSLGHEKAGLIGPNGCGKTTLFHIIMGLLQPTEGKIIFKGKQIRTPKDLQRLRVEVGFLFQSSDDQLFSPTVLEDVAFGPLNLGMSPDEAREVAIETLEQLGLKGFEERITHRLSGGEKKLVALATILSMKPKVLLLDEPTNNLDPETMVRLKEILRSLKLPHVIISHDWDFLENTTNSLYTFEKGKILRCKENHIHVHRHVHAYGDRPHHHND